MQCCQCDCTVGALLGTITQKYIYIYIHLIAFASVVVNIPGTFFKLCNFENHPSRHGQKLDISFSCY